MLILKQRGVYPIGVEALASITQDFYEMIEGFMPGFVRFRQRQQRDSEPRGPNAPYLPPSF